MAATRTIRVIQTDTLLDLLMAYARVIQRKEKGIENDERNSD